MTQKYFEANREKIRQIILYIAWRVNNPTLHTVFKMMYFADKLHLEGYGRFITGDTYIAMEYGPVPSIAYDITKDAREFSLSHGLEVRGYHILALRDANLGLLSESDTECLNITIERYRGKSFGELTDESHDAAWRSSEENGEITIESIVRLFDDAEDLLAHLQDQTP